MRDLVGGIDAGSNTVKAVILHEKEIVSYAIMKTGANSKETAENVFKVSLSKINRDESDISYLIATGYGRNFVAFADHSITEISCHARGVHFIFPEVRTIIDIGGQDSKVIYLDKMGNVIDFLMNDKCAAGTGRFLEVIASALNLSLEEMSKASLKAKSELEISSTCTVFAESEVVGHVARGEDLSSIIAGIHRSIVKRVMGMARRRPILSSLCVTGGVAKNAGVVKMIRDEVGQEVIVPPEPQITGALGAALSAQDKAVRRYPLRSAQEGGSQSSA